MEEFSYTIGIKDEAAHGACSSLRAAIINNGSVFTINELQLPECWYPENWKGLEWHPLNPGAQILAAAQSSEFSTGVQHHNKRTLSGIHGRRAE